jgi:hypothetical protein
VADLKTIRHIVPDGFFYLGLQRGLARGQGAPGRDATAGQPSRSRSGLLGELKRNSCAIVFSDNGIIHLCPLKAAWRE